MLVQSTKDLGDYNEKTFKVQNISCINCSNLIKGSLEDDFGDIEVNLETTPKKVTVEISNESQETKFEEEMSDIGFDVIE
ncbi:MAG: heavy metal transport/detoxification protein [Epsilonproteobacteria bacterium]|nr:MAG: heavy metal transport/detoxification protein [Campylobacterota bacterium]